MPAAHLEKVCRKYALVQQHGKDPHPLGDLQRRCVRRRDTEDGMVKIEAILHPEEAELVWTMLNDSASRLTREPCPKAMADSPEAPNGTRTTETGGDAEALAASPSRTGVLNHEVGDSAESRKDGAACDADDGVAREAVRAAEIAGDALRRQVRNERPSTPLHQRADATRRAFDRADALVSLAQAYLRGDQPDRPPIEVVLTIPAASLRSGAVDAADVGEIGASFVSNETARRMSCDCGVVEVVEDDHGAPRSVGRKRRTIAGVLRRALRQRDKACRFPGCTNRLFLEGHNIQHWADGGETSLENATLLCSLHHHYVHEYGYSIELDAHQRPRFRDRHGRIVPDVPERPIAPDTGWPRIRAANAERFSTKILWEIPSLQVPDLERPVRGSRSHALDVGEPHTTPPA